LATPHLAGVLEQRPGVQFKGQRLTTFFEEEKYSIADYEEDGMSLLIIPLLCVYNLYNQVPACLAGIEAGCFHLCRVEGNTV